MGKKSQRKKSKSFLNFLTLGMAILMLFGFFSSLFSERAVPRIEPDYYIEETESYSLVGDSLNPDTLITNVRYWENYWNNTFTGSIKILSSQLDSANNHKDNLEIITYTEEDWTSVYRALVNYEAAYLDQVIWMLDSIRVKLSLSAHDFSEVVVSFVQDIPYSYILRHSCPDRYTVDESFRNAIDNGTNCYDNISYGINTPAEFLGSLHGDCDTRTVLLYKLMSHFGYDVAILGSSFYRHSILGINMPGGGVYIKYRGKKYYVWETTNIGWVKGEIPPNNSTLSYWEVNLASDMN